eukprot:TRINITY_DN3480_c0_g1_i1.p2 TRINITY_DN3480_c0_g1~~TRINITY_DN3480_c0_g1_i1.p2  ORF type:complete len:168 (-),score=34.62 TRINITY_DN3480_c0_g1_i1:144-647(-)
MATKTAIEKREAFAVAFVEHIGPYHLIGPKFREMAAFITGTLGKGESGTLLGAFFNNPRDTPPEALKSRVCAILTSPHDHEKATGSGKEIWRVAGGHYAVAHSKIPDSEFAAAHAALGLWVAAQAPAWRPDAGRPVLEHYFTPHGGDPPGFFVLDIMFPVIPVDQPL